MHGNKTVLIFSEFQMELYINTTLEFSWPGASRTTLLGGSSAWKIPIRTTVMGEELVWEARFSAKLSIFLSGRVKNKNSLLGLN
jgi:hypothetical protein